MATDVFNITGRYCTQLFIKRYKAILCEEYTRPAGLFVHYCVVKNGYIACYAPAFGALYYGRPRFALS